MKYIYKLIVFSTVVSLALVGAMIYAITITIRKVLQLHERQTRR